MGKSFLLSTISGLLLALSWPTYGVPIFLFFAFVPLLLIEKQFSEAPFKRKSLRIFLLSFWSFVLWNALSYSWLSQAKPQIDATSSEIQQAWFAYLFPVIINSLLMASVFIVYHFIRKKHGGFYGFIFLPAFWMTFEKLHLNWDFTWPWLNLGNGFASFPEWVQWYETTGVFGGTLWVWIANLLLFKTILTYLEHGQKKSIYKLGLGFLAVIIIPISFSYLTYFNYEEKGEEVEIVLIQPELNPYKEKYEKSGDEIVDQLLTLAEKEVTDNTDFIITPETSIPGRGSVVMNDFNADPLINKIQRWLKKHPKAIFIPGVDLAKLTTSQEAPNITAIEYQNGLWINRYNSTIQLSNLQDSIPSYHKSKLVVGVEYFPYPQILKPILGSLMLNFGGSTNSLTKSKERTIFTNKNNNGKVAPIICYESIYGELTSEFVKNGANMITVSTNDSWWGLTDGHRQLLNYARLRAIENRRSIARAANSGVSCFINQRGDIISSLSYGKQGALKGNIKLNAELTNYSVAGDLLARLGLLISGVLIAYHILEQFMSKNEKK